MKPKISRRFFVTNVTAVTLSQLLFGCSYGKQKLQILLLENSIPLQSIADFRKQIDQTKKIDFQPNGNLLTIFDLLKNGQNSTELNKKINILSRILNSSPQSINLATLGDYWLAKAIQQKLIEPLNPEELNNWQKIPFSWQKLVKRDKEGKLAEDGLVFGAPYRWGSTIIAYRSDKFKQLEWTPKDWQDLWKPELRDRISLLDSPREVIGLTLKKLGHSYNTNDLSTITNLESQLQALHQQVKFYSSQNYLQPLILGDTWLAVGWSSDILPLVKRYPKIKFVIPQSGSSLWSDVWVKPQATADGTEETNLISQWIDFCWENRPAEQISLFTESISPIWAGKDLQQLPKNLQNNSFLSSEALSTENSEFLLPLDTESEKQYRNLWLKIRQG